jgi:hypothetical protein
VQPNVSLYASYANIFQPQTAQDARGATLAPEEGNTYEVGAKAEFFDKRLNASIAHFWMKTENTAEESGDLTPCGQYGLPCGLVCNAAWLGAGVGGRARARLASAGQSGAAKQLAHQRQSISQVPVQARHDLSL